MDKRMVFSSDRLRYRGIEERDAELVIAWRSDPENYKNFFNASPITLESHREWFSGYLEDPTRYDFIIINGVGRPIGTCGLSSITSESCEISYMIGDKASRGKGYAREAVRRLTELAFDELGVLRVEARVVPGNEASAKVVLGEGFSECEWVFRVEKPIPSDSRSSE